jgi:hypothetical protein
MSDYRERLQGRLARPPQEYVNLRFFRFALPITANYTRFQVVTAVTQISTLVTQNTLERKLNLRKRKRADCLDLCKSLSQLLLTVTGNAGNGKNANLRTLGGEVEA